jgi:hypothetical protein
MKLPPLGLGAMPSAYCLAVCRMSAVCLLVFSLLFLCLCLHQHHSDNSEISLQPRATDSRSYQHRWRTTAKLTY